jgi:trk system potassium uptake protein TrkH
LADSCLEYVSALSTVGLSVGITGPDMPVVLKLAQMFAMWLGRLEFIVVLVMFAKLRHDLTLK